MTEVQDVRGRLILYLATKKVKKRVFERQIGAANGFVNNIKRSMSPEKLEAISNSCPDLNITWLMTGRGDMLKVETFDTKEEAVEADREELDYKAKYEEAVRNLEKLRELYEQEQEKSKLKDLTIETLQKLVEVIDQKHSEGGINGDI